jgi:hypothetical protein
MRRREFAELVAETMPPVPPLLARADALAEAASRLCNDHPHLDPIQALRDLIAAYRHERTSVQAAVERRVTRAAHARAGKVRVQKRSPARKRGR